MNDKTLYRIINLSSGDNLIAQVTESATKAITVYRPFQMKVITLLDEGGPLSVSFRKEALIFRNWLEFSTDEKVIIPRDKVISITQPNDMVSNLYDQEKEKEDNPKYMDDLLEKLKKHELKEDLEDALDEAEEEFSISFEDIDMDEVIDNVTVEIDPEDIRDLIERMINDAKNIKFPFDSSNEEEEIPEENLYDEDKDMFGW
tara:strand:+ start:192 stop:797 length:606 start_codon:yes stop_codon:yes gene_type:complete